MSLTSRLVSWLMKLPPAQTRKIVITRDLRVPMPDGAILLADHYTPRQGSNLPTILVRSPYGRRGYVSLLYALPYAERGYQVVIQSCRGTDGSAGNFTFARLEHDDGLATLAWLKQQPWFSGSLAMVGESYLGFAQWSIAAETGPELKAIFPTRTSSDFNHFRFPGGSLLLEMWLDWTTWMTVLTTTKTTFLRTMLTQNKRKRLLLQAFQHLPLKEADRMIIQQPSESFQETLSFGPEHEHWQDIDRSHSMQNVTIPVHLTAGWYDLLLLWQLKDYQALRAAGQEPHLTIGPWTHPNPAATASATREALTWLPAYIAGKPGPTDQALVRLYVMGVNTWRDFSSWPPPAQVQPWYLQPGQSLSVTPPPPCAPDQYRYDPTNPTPSVGGNSLGPTATPGPRDNRALEARADVLVYTSAILEKELEIIGPVVANLYVHSTLKYTDFFTRLCVIEPSGKSMNLCDNILRLTPESDITEGNEVWHIQIELWPTAYRFQPGQRIRVQVSSGAHPRFARNPGSGEPLGTATILQQAEQTIYHDPEHPSAFLLPVVQEVGAP